MGGSKKERKREIKSLVSSRKFLTLEKTCKSQASFVSEKGKIIYDALLVFIVGKAKQAVAEVSDPCAITEATRCGLVGGRVWVSVWNGERKAMPEIPWVIPQTNHAVPCADRLG